MIFDYSAIVFLDKGLAKLEDVNFSYSKNPSARREGFVTAVKRLQLLKSHSIYKLIIFFLAGGVGLTMPNYYVWSRYPGFIKADGIFNWILDRLLLRVPELVRIFDFPFIFNGFD